MNATNYAVSAAGERPGERLAIVELDRLAEIYHRSTLAALT
jgi:hypothetical protein